MVEMVTELGRRKRDSTDNSEFFGLGRQQRNRTTETLHWNQQQQLNQQT